MKTPKAFKEWSLICDELLAGKQSIILRKGGIAEGRQGFAFSESSFYLLPTYFHDQVNLTTLKREVTDPQKGSPHTILGYAETAFTSEITDWSKVEALAPFHCWTLEALRERFEYKEANTIYFAMIRVYRLESPWVLNDGPAFKGCKSWIDLPENPPNPGQTPVLSEVQFSTLETELKEILK